MQDKYIIIVAGGKGLRMSSDLPKQFILLNGRPVLMHTIEAFYRYDSAIHIVLVLPEDHKNYWENLCTDYEFSISHQVVAGGETRFHSVRNALLLLEKQLPSDELNLITGNRLIGVHDGVRPLVSKKLIDKVYEQADFQMGAYPAIAVTDSLRKLSNSKRNSTPVDRSKYFLVQTPQVFRSDVLFQAYKQEYKQEFTDDVSVVEAAGICRPVMVEGSRENQKITTPIDLVVAQVLIKCRI
jgi:2-C-methyl-D-erythritol 4-phosphate cytidylyltransferase